MSLQKCLLKSLPTFKWSCVVYILDASPCQIVTEKIFLPLSRLSFKSFYSVLCTVYFLNSSQVHINFIFIFVISAFVSHLKAIVQPKSQTFNVLFSDAGLYKVYFSYLVSLKLHVNFRNFFFYLRQNLLGLKTLYWIPAALLEVWTSVLEHWNGSVEHSRQWWCQSVEHPRQWCVSLWSTLDSGAL